MQKYLIIFIVKALLILALPPGCPADIYRYIDSDGVVHLTNVPTDTKIPYVLVLKEKRVGEPVRLQKKESEFDGIIARVSRTYGVDPAIVKAVIKAESNFDRLAVSPKGARGLMQLMPATAASLRVRDHFHPESNIEGGVRYLSYLMDLFKGNLTLVLAAYNAGEESVFRYNYQVPPFKETRAYVRRVLNYVQDYRRKSGY